MAIDQHTDVNIEVAVDEVEHAIRAEELGADRIELCANLNEGGTTPSFGMIRQCVVSLNIPVVVMIRPRPGHFYYNKTELRMIHDDIINAANAGAQGIVIGLLDSNGQLAVQMMARIIRMAKQRRLEVTFHRAFDVCTAPWVVLEQLMKIGVTRLLTSGRQPKAIDGKDFILDMVTKTDGRLEIIAGAGINADNARALETTGVEAIHFTCRKKMPIQDDPMSFGRMWTFDPDKLIAVKSALGR
jgi:copper homeostasis protein